MRNIRLEIKNFDQLILLISVVTFVGLFLLLALNTNRGFDISDDGYYILAAKYATNWYLTSFHEGYYTSFFYNLFGGNVSYLRLAGLFLLVSSAFLFSKNLLPYVKEVAKIQFNKINEYSFIILVTTASLFYYKSWLMTPSYNLISLSLALLVLADVFWIINNYNDIRGGILRFEHLTLGVLLVLLFVVKITVSLSLVISILIFLIFNRKHIYFVTSFATIGIVSGVVLLSHVYIVFGGFEEYFRVTLNSLSFLKAADAGHGLGNIIGIFKSYKNHAIANQILILSSMLFMVAIFIISIVFKRNNKVRCNIVVWSLFTIFLLFVSYIYFQSNPKNRSWFIFSVVVITIVINYFVLSHRSGGFIYHLKEYRKIFSLLLLLVLSSVSVSYGTNNDLIGHMTMSNIFIVTLLIVISYKFRSINESMSVSKIAHVFILYSVVVTVIYGFMHPYRLNTPISMQVEDLGSLGLKVDKEFKYYISKFQDVSNDNEIEYLLDMTGASSGVTAILELNYIGSPWMLGGYRGSNNFALKMLKNEDKMRLKKAWILTAPKGKRSIDLTILNEVDINFPKDYQKVMTSYFKLRDETQELWKPINNIE